MDFVHKFVPAKAVNHHRTLVLLHGTGGNEEDLIPLGSFLSPETALLGIRGKVLEGGMPRFFRRLSEGVFDEADLIFQTHELARFLEEACEAYQLEPSGLIAVGYSNGANIAASVLLLEPKIFSAAVLFRAMLPLQPEARPDLYGKPILMQCGTLDPLIPASNSEQLAQLFELSGADVTLNWETTGHGLTQPELVVAKDWVRHL